MNGAFTTWALWGINGLIGVILSMIGARHLEIKEELKTLRQRVHDSINRIAALEAINYMRDKRP